MGNPKTIAEILALAERLESGATTIGDFLRAKVVYSKTPDRSPVLRRETLYALIALSRAAMLGYKKSDCTYGLIQEQLRCISHATLLGLLDGNFFSQIGRYSLAF
jgi:hypothetical protein